MPYNPVMKLTDKEKQNLWQTIGQNIARYRTKAGITQAALAHKAGFSPLFIGLIERGRRPAPVATLVAIAKALEVKLSDLIKGL